jgi:hypothetical protein
VTQVAALAAIDDNTHDSRPDQRFTRLAQHVRSVSRSSGRGDA